VTIYVRRFGSPARTIGRRRSACQSLVAAAFILVASAGASAVAAPEPQVTVREDAGVYTVSATFTVAEPASTAVAVLTDYEQIPRFMPDIRRSSVLERSEQMTVVEQEAVARLMMFSKRIHLILEVHNAAGVIRFRDRCGKSFARYEGGWTITENDGQAAIAYELTAKPSFDVPEFLLKRLLKRDAMQMIERLQAEMAARPRAARIRN
jgi:ribosome-associated toxin RatA of RatAB toxin-antitoxin module